MAGLRSETDNTNETTVQSEGEKWGPDSVRWRVYHILEDNFEDWTVREYYRLVKAAEGKGLTDDQILEEYARIHEKLQAYEQRMKKRGLSS